MTASFRPVALMLLSSRAAVRLRVGELQRIERAQAGVVLGPRAAVEQQLQPLGRRHPEVMAALRADLLVVDQLLVVDGAPARRALDPETFRDAARLSRCDLMGFRVFLNQAI